MSIANELLQISTRVSEMENELAREKKFNQSEVRNGRALQSKVMDLSDTIKEQKGVIDDLKAKLKVVESSVEEVWYWDPDENDPDSLTCPVVMSADRFREYESLAAEKVRIELENERLKKLVTDIGNALGGNTADTFLVGHVAQIVSERDHYHKACVKLVDTLELVAQQNRDCNG